MVQCLGQICPCVPNGYLKLGRSKSVPPQFFMSGQLTKEAWAVSKRWLPQTPHSTQFRVSACPFNVPPVLLEETEGFPDDIQKYDVPCYGRILDAVMTLFAIPDVRDFAMSKHITIPAYKLDTFIQGKIKLVMQMIQVARQRPDCIGQNLMAADRLESFVSAFEALDGARVNGVSDWRAFVEKHVPAGWESRLAFENVLANFGFDDAFASALRKETVEVIQMDGSKSSITWEYQGVRWVSKALGGYKPVGCFTDVVNLAFAMRGVPVADVSNGLSEGDVLQVIGSLRQDIEKKRLDNLWIPTHVMLDGESDDMLLWCLVGSLHKYRGTSFSIMGQLPTSDEADRIEAIMKQRLGFEVFRDADSRNLKAIAHYWQSVPDCHPQTGAKGTEVAAACPPAGAPLLSVAVKV